MSQPPLSTDRTRSHEILERNRRHIPGGMASLNRAVSPEITFVRGEGQWLFDADGRRYLDYHAAFAPHILGHNDPCVTAAVKRVLDENASLYGSGTTMLEGRLAELICEAVPFVEQVQLLNSGSEATYQALRLARAVTGRDHVIVMQGGYNGWHNDVACNVMTPLAKIGPRISPGEYEVLPLSAGVPESHRRLVHAINFNDLDSVAYVCERYPVAALITEPVLQNIGVVHPRPGYLAGLRQLADRHGFLLIFDEVKTGFRHGPGGYAHIAGVRPDLAVYGKALANGYPMAAIGGPRMLMEYFAHPDDKRRVFLAGTCNAHPVPTAAAIATLERLLAAGGEIYERLEGMGQRLESGLAKTLRRQGVTGVVARQGSALCVYFMDHAPVDWHDLAAHHRFEPDVETRVALIEAGIYVFPLATKQWSISAAHTTEDIDATVRCFEAALERVKAGARR